jgi:hypothetical protein
LSFNYTYRYTDDVLSINYHSFPNYASLIYPDEEIKDITESDLSASHLNNSQSRLTTTLYNKRDGFDFAVVNFPYSCSNILLSPTYGV